MKLLQFYLSGLPGCLIYALITQHQVDDFLTPLMTLAGTWTLLFWTAAIINGAVSVV